MARDINYWSHYLGFWGSFIGYKIIIEYYGGSMITFVVGAVLFLGGLIFPAKIFLRNKET
jgi:hypothetical protein